MLVLGVIGFYDVFILCYKVMERRTAMWLSSKKRFVN
jgi:hypothetical protein